MDDENLKLLEDIEGKNVTPKIVIVKPVVNQGIKGVLDLLRQFVSVGGDFV
jgi:hypothetical protein